MRLAISCRNYGCGMVGTIRHKTILDEDRYCPLVSELNPQRGYRQGNISLCFWIWGRDRGMYQHVWRGYAHAFLGSVVGVISVLTRPLST